MLKVNFPKRAEFFSFAEDYAKKHNQQKLLNNPFYLSYAICLKDAKLRTKNHTILKKIFKENPNCEIKNFYGYNLASLNLELPLAEQIIREALTEKPNDPNILNSLALTLFKQKKYPEALKIINKLLENKIIPKAVVFEHAGDIYLAAGQTKKAISAYKKALNIYSPSLDYKKLNTKLKLLKQ